MAALRIVAFNAISGLETIVSSFLFPCASTRACSHRNPNNDISGRRVLVMLLAERVLLLLKSANEVRVSTVSISNNMISCRNNSTVR